MIEAVSTGTDLACVFSKLVSPHTNVLRVPLSPKVAISVSGNDEKTSETLHCTGCASNHIASQRSTVLYPIQKL